MEKELLNELHELNSTLAPLKQLPQNSAKNRIEKKASLPANYFDSLPNSVMLRLELAENDCNLLANLSKKAPGNRSVNLPNNYFEQNIDAVFERILEETNNEKQAAPLQLVVLPKKTTLYKRVATGFAAAAMLAGAFFYFKELSFYEKNIEQATATEMKNIFSEITQQDAVAYTREHAYEIDETELAEHAENLKLHHVLGISHQDVQNYLDENEGMVED